MLALIKNSLERGDWREADRLCHESAGRFDHEALFHLYRGAILAQQQDLDAAEQAFQRAIQLDQTLVAPHKNLAQIYKAKSDPRVVESLVMATWLDPQDPGPFQDLHRLSPELFQFPRADIVFYTGTPWLQMKFSPDSLETGALGGSETAFVMMACELSRLGKKVVCFCNTNARKNYDGVDYIPVAQFFLYVQANPIPILIASRFLHPMEQGVRAGRRLLWLHDTLGCASGEAIGPHRDRIDFLLGLSDYHIQQVCQRHHLPETKFLKTRNGFIADHFLMVPKKIPHSLIYLSRPGRGLAEALEIHKRLKKILPQVSLHVCGYSQWNQVAQDQELSGLLPRLQEAGVHYHGGLGKRALAHLLCQMEVMLYPNVSAEETCCIAAIEAMAAGVPVVTSGRGALPETVVDGVGGCVVPFAGGGEVLMQSLEKTTLELLTHKERLQALSKSAYDHAWKKYRWDQIAREWVELFL